MSPCRSFRDFAKNLILTKKITKVISILIVQMQLLLTILHRQHLSDFLYYFKVSLSLAFSLVTSLFLSVSSSSLLFLATSLFLSTAFCTLSSLSLFQFLTLSLLLSFLSPLSFPFISLLPTLSAEAFSGRFSNLFPTARELVGEHALHWSASELFP